MLASSKVVIRSLYVLSALLATGIIICIVILQLTATSSRTETLIFAPAEQRVFQPTHSLWIHRAKFEAAMYAEAKAIGLYYYADEPKMTASRRRIAHVDIIRSGPVREFVVIEALGGSLMRLGWNLSASSPDIEANVLIVKSRSAFDAFLNSGSIDGVVLSAGINVNTTIAGINYTTPDGTPKDKYFLGISSVQTSELNGSFDVEAMLMAYNVSTASRSCLLMYQKSACLLRAGSPDNAYVVLENFDEGSQPTRRVVYTDETSPTDTPISVVILCFVALLIIVFYFLRRFKRHYLTPDVTQHEPLLHDSTLVNTQVSHE